MTSRLVVAAVALGCIVAAGTGGYLAVRTSTHTSEAAPAPAPAPAGESKTRAGEPASIVAAAGTATSTTPVVPVPAVTDMPVPREARHAAPPAAPRATERQSTGTQVGAPHPVSEPIPDTSIAPAIEVEADEPPPTVAFPPAMPTDAPPEVPSTPPLAAAVVAAPPVEQVELSRNTVIGIRLDTTVSSETARVEDPVLARVTRAVVVDGTTIIPSGARLNGFVSYVEPGGKLRTRARIGIRFTSVDLSDDVRVPVETETIYREGDPPAGEATAKIGASAVVGTILGGVFGGKKGAAIGGAAGAAGGTAMVVTGDRNPAVLVSGTALTIRLSEPAVFTTGR